MTSEIFLVALGKHWDRLRTLSSLLKSLESTLKRVQLMRPSFQQKARGSWFWLLPLRVIVLSQLWAVTNLLIVY